MMCFKLGWRYKALRVIDLCGAMSNCCCICLSFAGARREMMAKSWPTLPSFV
ncbi:hypothetical protein BDP55DRAFT_651072 [Colletotrichum godetiae]|uniref:Uncharacterized protein n=1 Tax=Colletotrichum godetiae TaxID=1209918 RepID=A0AAJ0F2I8_9PEZI|nr:uncharacterized protein BDP55DRAFT_651072 [Colletotrichum godetiae]KAK1690538.1 hypothetical protein BDP55DRAFT_651072 [Colletotrichum godetiae]